MSLGVRQTVGGVYYLGEKNSVKTICCTSNVKKCFLVGRGSMWAAVKACSFKGGVSGRRRRRSVAVCAHFSTARGLRE